ncbi:Wzt carbohydrate-binding domain-containing protein [Luteitalea sp.]|uniref:ABC transporter ATP-binding protein n=1 Tax=Luteitalea sp. TaxID=2004800 RepID=UPI0025BD350D|nr:Wzt carbohydrate-binding domain-containing protein [Luteitalea sp.]
MPGTAAPILAVEGLGRAFDIFPSDGARTRHLIWSAATHLPGVAPTARQRRAALTTRTWALRDVSFTVGRGESVGVIGANGSGKSTLLHLLCGTLAASEGAVHTTGRIGALLELGTGFSPDLTGRENIRLSGLLHGVDEATIGARTDAIAAFADIGAYLEQPVRTYSSGMYVRLAFAVMAHLDAEVLIVDEALAVGDIRFVQKCLAHLDRFRARGGTLLFVSHDLPAVQRLCNRVIWLDRGRLCMDGPPREVTEAYFDSMIGNRAPGTGHREPGSGNREPGSGHPPPPTASAGRGPDSGMGSPSLADSREGRLAEPAASPAAAGARLVEVRLVDASDRPVTTIVGGEQVTLHVEAASRRPLAQPVIGFYVKDRLGQQLFGDNTLAAAGGPAADDDGRLVARFSFVMPRLFPGEYLVAVAIADGTQADHVHHEWRHEAWQFVSAWPGGATGLVGIDVEVRWLDPARP